MGADTGLIEALKNLKKGMELVVKELKIKGGRLPRPNGTIPVPSYWPWKMQGS